MTGRSEARWMVGWTVYIIVFVVILFNFISLFEWVGNLL